MSPSGPPREFNTEKNQIHTYFSTLLESINWKRYSIPNCSNSEAWNFSAFIRKTNFVNISKKLLFCLSNKKFSLRTISIHTEYFYSFHNRSLISPIDGDSRRLIEVNKDKHYPPLLSFPIRYMIVNDARWYVTIRFKEMRGFFLFFVIFFKERMDSQYEKDFLNLFL